MERHAHFGKYISRVSRDIDESTLARVTWSPIVCFLPLQISSAARRQIPLCGSHSEISASVRISAPSRHESCLSDDPHSVGCHLGEASL